MQDVSRFNIKALVGVPLVFTSVALLTACASKPKADTSVAVVQGLKEIKTEGAVDLRLKADPKRSEIVSYTHKSRSTSYEDVEVRQQKEESLEFTSQAETKVPPDAKTDRFMQVLTILKKDGQANLHDFAMPELGEKLEVTSDTRGRIIRAGDYPTNSIFFVPPISLPTGPVHVGDTWALQANWMSLEEMVPYQLDMASIFRRVLQCGAHRCAEIEISGEVTLQGNLAQVMAFKSLWKGYLMFDIDAGTVVWSRVDSEEQFASGNVRRSVTSCLESTLTDPPDLRLTGLPKNACTQLPQPGDIAPKPGSMM